MTGPQSSRRYALELIAVLAGYLVLLALSVVLVRAAGDSPWRWLAVLLPVPAVVAVAWAVLRQIRRSDELQGRISVEALAIGFAIGSLITFSYGFLQLAGAPQLSWFFVWPVYAVGWLIGVVITRRRY
ncbi:hypothetical protein [Microlunatus speluncae]|uniref:hypothetical protein n=1 Tax=Microlunatus speluncae TaxID=2594267 RepID=UPI0012664A1A|nr:hypothetical protein [Microlunatus speluncae]